MPGKSIYRPRKGRSERTIIRETTALREAIFAIGPFLEKIGEIPLAGGEMVLRPRGDFVIAGGEVLTYEQVAREYNIRVIIKEIADYLRERYIERVSKYVIE